MQNTTNMVPSGVDAGSGLYGGVGEGVGIGVGITGDESGFGSLGVEGGRIYPKSHGSQIHPILFKFLLQIRSYNMDILFPQQSHDKVREKETNNSR